MKKTAAIILSFIMVLGIFPPAAYAQEEIIRVVEEENTEEYENESVNVFDPQIIYSMSSTDSFVDKTASIDSFDIPCKAGFLMEENSGQILYVKNPDEKLAMASITKIMTMLLVMEALDAGTISLNDTVPISSHAFSMGGSQIWAEPGEVFTVHEMLKATAISSANDAAVALGELVGGGSEEVFCDMMNRRAKELGMENTHFINACGLDADGHYSSAHDVAIMAKELMKHTKIFEYTTTWMDYLRNGETQMVNTNKLLRSYSGITGLKTGTTGKAGICICATAKRNDMSLIAVVLGAPSSQERFSAAKKMLDFGFANFETKSFPDTSQIPRSIKVKYSEIKQAELDCQVPQSLLFVKGSTANLTCKVDVPEYIAAPMYKGMKVGSVSLYSESGKIKEYDIVLTQDIVKIDFNKALAILTKSLANM